jgi:hypothetical protein
MANNNLIQGERFAITGGSKQGGFFDVAEAVGSGLDIAAKVYQAQEAKRQEAKAQKEAEIARTNQKVGKMLSQLDTNVDLTGISPAQQKIVKNFLLDKRQEYVDAANAIAQYSPTDREYMDYADIMQNVNNEIASLSNNLKAYKTSQAEFLEDGFKNRLSNADTTKINTAADIYSRDADFNIKGGNLMFKTEGGEVNYSDFRNPAIKAYDTANAIMKMTEAVNSTGEKLTQNQKDSLRLQLLSAFDGNPEILQSIAVDKLLSPGMLNIDYTQFDDVASLQEGVINSLMNGFEKVANDSHSRKQNKGGGQRQYNFRLAYREEMRFKHPDGKFYDRQIGTDGSTRFVDQRGNIYKGDSNELIDLRRSPEKTTTTPSPTQTDKDKRNEIIQTVGAEARKSGLSKAGVKEAVNEALREAKLKELE